MGMEYTSRATTVRRMAATAEENVESYKHRVDQVLSLVKQLEQRVEEVEQFYAKKKPGINSGRRNSSSSIDKPPQQDGGRGGGTTTAAAAASMRMEALIRQCRTILQQISEHEMAWPFMHPVEAERLGLHDYHEVIKKPMDIGTIQKNINAGRYKHVREVCADVRLVFKNAMLYNEEGNDVHSMAKTIVALFEEKWRLQLLPKVTEEEAIRLAEQEAAYGKMAKELSNELFEMDTHLDELRDSVVQNCCRKISTEEKRHLAMALTRLSMDDLAKALDIVAQSNPEGFQQDAEQVDLDIDAQSEYTLWRLKFFVKSALRDQEKPPLITTSSEGGGGGGDCNNNYNYNNKNESKTHAKASSNTKRKREICNAIAKTAKKKSRRMGV